MIEEKVVKEKRIFISHSYYKNNLKLYNYLIIVILTILSKSKILTTLIKAYICVDHN